MTQRAKEKSYLLDVVYVKTQTFSIDFDIKITIHCFSLNIFEVLDLVCINSVILITFSSAEIYSNHIPLFFIESAIMELTRREERLAKIAQLLKRTGKIHLKQAAVQLDVSEMTIRRDINAEPCDIALLGGYLVGNQTNSGVGHYFVSDQKNRFVTEKQAIGTLGAQLIEPEDTVFFDCGTTVPYLIDAIDDDLVFTAICYSLNTFLALQDKPKCRVILCGGEFKGDNYTFTSIGSRNELDDLRPNKAFLSAAGISLDFGVTCYNLDELPMKQRALTSSQQRILIADHSKFGQTRAAYIGALSQFDTLITDQAPKAEFIEYFQSNRINLITAEKS